MDQDKGLEKRISLRIFRYIWVDIVKTTNHAKDPYGFRKYENVNHFIRCSIMKLINEEKKTLDITRGRPKIRIGG